MIDNENYHSIKNLIKEKSMIELTCLLRIAGEKLFTDNKEVQPLFNETYLLMMLILKFFGDPEVSPEDLETLNTHLNEQFEKIDRILAKKFKKPHLRLIKS